MPLYELWSERECSPDKKLVGIDRATLDQVKAQFETLISRWEEEFDNHWNSDEDDLSFSSKVLPGAEEGCNFVLKDEHGKSLFMYTHEWEVVR